jgi:hypothetical protein
MCCSRVRASELLLLLQYLLSFCALHAATTTRAPICLADLTAIRNNVAAIVISLLCCACHVSTTCGVSCVTLAAESNCSSGAPPCKLWKLFGSGFPGTPQGSTGWACFPGPHYPNATDPSCHSGGDCDKELGGCLFELASDPTGE